MLEDQVATLLQRYLGNYVRGLNKEALKISVWRGDVELTNMQLKPEALNALKLPVKVKAGFLGSIRLKVPWSRLGQEPVLVYLDRILILAEPATQVEGLTEDTIQEAKRTRVREMEMRLLESQQQLKSEMSTSWLGSLINTIIGNLKLSISNIHVRYEDLESNPGHPFAAGLTLARLSAVTVDDAGKETFATGGALEHIQKSVELERLAFYLDSDICPWSVAKPWEDLLPSEWSQIFELERSHSSSAEVLKEHCYILQPVTGNAKYTKLHLEEFRNMGQPLQKASVNLEDVTLCLSKDGYKDILRLADNFAAFNQRVRYSHYRPCVPIKSDPRSWWKYAYKVVTDEMKKASGILSWEQVLMYAKLRKRYISLYASLLKSDAGRMVVDDNEDIKKLDREIDIDVILQWRMLAHKFVQESTESDVYQNKQKSRQSWWSFGWTGSSKEEGEREGFTEEDWERLNKIIGYKEDNEQMLITQDKGDLLHFFLEVHMKHNASRLISGGSDYLADLSCADLDCAVKIYSEAKAFDLKLGSYRLSSPSGLLAESATVADSLVGVFSYKPFDSELDWSFVAKASPCYMTYLKDSIDDIISFFKSSTTISQTIALETAAAVQITLDEVKRTAQQQVTRALKDHARFLLDLDIAAPKITVPTEFCPDKIHATKLLLDLGNLKLFTQDKNELYSPERRDLNLQFNVVLNDVSAFLVDGEYSWSQAPTEMLSGPAKLNNNCLLPVIDKCGIVLRLQQVQSENLFSQSTKLAIRMPAFGFHFSPARYHRLMRVFKLFQDDHSDTTDFVCPWNQSDLEGWLSVLSWKGVGNRDAVWQRRYLSIVGPFLYILENPSSKTYKHYFSLRGKQVHQVPLEFTGDEEHVLAVCDAGQLNMKAVEDVNAVILRCDTDESRRTWQNRLQAAIYRASGSAAISGHSDASPQGIMKRKPMDDGNMKNLYDMEKVFITGVLDELKICFSCNYQSNQNFNTILLGKESGLFEFRATGGQVELSIRQNDLFIGTVLKSLEIEDLFFCEGLTKPRYLARSFIKNADDTVFNSSPFFTEVGEQNFSSSEQNQVDSDDKFFEASDNLSDFMEPTVQSQGDMPQDSSAMSSFPSADSSMKAPSFNRIPGLLPDAKSQNGMDLEKFDTLDSFVMAQIIIFDQDSPLYNSIDKQVMVGLATLSFFCHRPTILAIMEFVNAVNAEEDSLDVSHDTSSADGIHPSDDVLDQLKSDFVQEPVVKGLLGKGKTRVIFHLTLNMATAQIFLMNENGTCLVTLLQNNLLMEIKVFPSSFQIKACLGNLKISDDSLPSEHSYFWVCDMKNTAGSSFVELDFSSYSMDDEDYDGYDYSLIGQLSEVRIVYLHRFVLEVVSYFTGLAPSNSKGLVKLKDRVTNTEKWFTATEIEGSPAVKLDLSLSKPVIRMPRRTDSPDYLELDVLEIAVQNTFQWFGGDKNEMSAVHLETLTIKVKDINLTIGTGIVTGESIIQDVKGLSVVIYKSLRDLLHQIPSTDATIKVEQLTAALSNREYQIITECTLSNLSEIPHFVPPVNIVFGSSVDNNSESQVALPSEAAEETMEKEEWITMKITVIVNLVELSLYSGSARDSSLATVQASGAWLLYKSDSLEQAFLSATLKHFTVIDDREGTKQEFRLAIGKHENVQSGLLHYDVEDNYKSSLTEKKVTKESDFKSVPTMLILDVKFKQSSTMILLSVQRPHLLVALDFLLAIVVFFVPTVRSILSNEIDEDPLCVFDAIILDQQIYSQPCSEFILNPKKPLIVDGERFDHFIYDGKGGNLCLQDRLGVRLSNHSTEAMIFVGNGKRLQFRNVYIKNGEFLDACIYLGANSSYSASEDDNVFLVRETEDVSLGTPQQRMTKIDDSKVPADRSSETEYVIELQAIGPELTFYSTSRNVSDSLVMSTKSLHAQFDIFCRLVMKGNAIELSGNLLGLKLETNGIRVLEPFDSHVKFSNVSGKTSIYASISDIYMNFSFSILKLFLAIEEDILEFLRMTTNKVSVVCSQFDKVGTIQNYQSGQTYAFWRPRAPPGFAILGDCLTPLNEPPSKGVTAVNTSFARVKRPISFELIWPCLATDDILVLPNEVTRNNCSTSTGPNTDKRIQESSCSIWFPVAPQGYIAVGCVVSIGRVKPPLSSALCILSSLVSRCSLKDCISLYLSEPHPANIALWRVDNSFGSFLPSEPSGMSLIGKAYELRHLCFAYSESSSNPSVGSIMQSNSLLPEHALQLERYALLTSSRLFEPIASFRLIWCNQGASPHKRLSIWRPVVPHGMAYLGDIAVQGYEPPNTCVVLHDTGDETFLKPALDFQPVGHIKKQKGTESISFWLPQAPPGFVSLGCIASKVSPKQEDFSTLRCIRSDLVTGNAFPEESIWDSSDTKMAAEPFSIWSVGNEACTFLIRKGFKKPPKRFALRLADPSASSGSDDTVIDVELNMFSAAVYDDYAGLMVPLFSISFSRIGFNVRQKLGSLNSTMSFSLAASSYNDKIDLWEPLVEPVDGSVRYQYDLRVPGAISQLRISTTRDLNLIVSVSNTNMIVQAESSWNSLNNAPNSYGKRAIVSPAYEGKSVIDVHNKRNYYIIPQNKLGQDIYIRLAENKRFSDIIRLPSGDNKLVTVPVSKKLMDSHLKGKRSKVSRCMVSIAIADAELPAVEGLLTGQYAASVRIFSSYPNESSLQQQTARTCGVISKIRSSSGLALVDWNETFFFKVDQVDHYMVEFIVIDLGRGEPVGQFSAPLKAIGHTCHSNSMLCHPDTSFRWAELSSGTMVSHSNTELKSPGRIRFSIFLLDRPEIENDRQGRSSCSTRGFIQISPTTEGPWTTVRLNYAAPAACWRLGNSVVASEVTVRDGNRYVNLRSLVSITNNTGFPIEVCLRSKASIENLEGEDNRDEQKENVTHSDIHVTDEFFQTEKYVSSIGWTGCSSQMPSHDQPSWRFMDGNSQGLCTIELPAGWEWVDDWHVDTSSVNNADGWVYASDPEHLKWPETFSPANSPNHARQRRWVRQRKYSSSGLQNCVSLGYVKPDEAVPLPLQCLVHPVLTYYLQLRPRDMSDLAEYSWSKALSTYDHKESNGTEEFSDISVSNLSESEELLYCPAVNRNSSDCPRDLWFCLSIRALEIGKEIHSIPIQDWNLVISSPLSFTNFLPLSAEYSVLHQESDGHFVICSRGSFSPGETVKVYNVDLREALYLSLVPQGGWEPMHEPVLVSHPNRMPSKTISLRSCFSGRVVQVILEQSHEKDQLQSRVIRIYVPYWISSARCPPLIYRIVDRSERRERKLFTFHSDQKDEKVVLEITQDEMLEGDTISAALNVKHLGISISLGKPGKENFGPVKDLLPLSDMDGSIDLYAYDTDGNCMRVLISSKPCRYQAVPTKVISVRPFMTFTNRVGQDVFIKFGSEDQQKVLCASDSRISFIYSVIGNSERLQVRLEDTNWSFPVEIIKEDTITMMLKNCNGGRKLLRLEIRGYEEGSRFLIVLRPGSAHGPIRVENRIANMNINIRQSSLGDDAWIPLQPLSSINFSWEVPYGPNLLDICIQDGISVYAQNVSLEKGTECSADLKAQGFDLHVLEVCDVTIARVTETKRRIRQQSDQQHRISSISNRDSSSFHEAMENTSAPMEVIIELGVVGISLVDHRPRELLYLYLEKVFISYASGYDGGTTSRFKLIVGQLQLDNQLPLSVMPVLLMPECMGDIRHPVFKTTITMSNENTDGIQVYPYVYIRVTENCWRVNIHEPIIWALVDFYDNLHIDRVPDTSNVAGVDPEIRIGLIDVSEIRLKVALETAPTERPHGVLGMWSPILSAVGNAFKVQVRLRKVMHINRLTRRSYIVPAIMNRIKRDLVHNPLHIILSVDVLGMTKSTLASLSKGFAELSTDVQFLQLRSKQVWSRRITGVSDGILQGTEALAQGVAFGVSGVITKPVESARERGVLGLPHGLGRAILGFIVQPVSGALDFVSLTVDGIGASCARCLELVSNKSPPRRVRNPRAVRANGLLTEYSEREATGQMILYLAEASRHLGCTDLFKEPSKYAWSDCYEDHFILPYQRILLITNKRVMLLLCLDPEKMDRKPCKIIWDVPWKELMALELAKAGYPMPSHLIIHLKHFKRSESFVRLVKCKVEEGDDQEPQAARICVAVRQTWKAHRSDTKTVTLRVPSSQRYAKFAWDEMNGGDSDSRTKTVIKPREFAPSSCVTDDRRFVKYSVTFQKIWSSERDFHGRCTLCPKQVVDGNTICIWRPICPDGYVSVGDIARVGIHQPNVAAVYRYSDGNFARPVGYDLVWRNCVEDYATPVSIWTPRPPEGFISIGCVGAAGFEEPHPDCVYCVNASITKESLFEEQLTWTAPDSFPWACYVYQLQSEALQFVALRQPKEESNWKPMEVLDQLQQQEDLNQSSSKG